MKLTAKITSVFLAIILFANGILAQCSICTKTAQQLGEGPAKALNNGILYLMLIPLSIIFIIGYRWYKREKQINKNNNQV